MTKFEWFLSTGRIPEVATEIYDLHTRYCSEMGVVSSDTFKRYCREFVTMTKSKRKMEKEVKKLEDNFNVEKTEEKITISTLTDTKLSEDDYRKTYHIDDRWECWKQTANCWAGKHQLKCEFRLKGKVSFSAKEFAEKFNAMLLDPPHVDLIKHVVTEEGNEAEIDLFDFHFGQMSRASETGDRDWNLEEASKEFINTVDYFLEETKGKVEKYLIPLGNDFFNVDNMQNTTFKGTPQQECSSQRHTFKSAEALYISQIDKIKNYGTVEIIIVPGNHDKTRVFFLGEYLRAWYRNDENVIVRNEDTPRVYHVWGKNLIGFTHGNEEAKGALPMLMYQEEPMLCAQTLYKEFKIGHWHHKEDKLFRLTNDTNGIRLSILPTLVPLSEYSAGKGYRSLSEAVCDIYNKERGKIKSLFYHPEG